MNSKTFNLLYILPIAAVYNFKTSMYTQFIYCVRENENTYGLKLQIMYQ